MGARSAFTGFPFNSLPPSSHGRDTFGVCKVDLLAAGVKARGRIPVAPQRALPPQMPSAPRCGPGPDVVQPLVVQQAPVLHTVTIASSKPVGSASSPLGGNATVCRLPSSRRRSRRMRPRLLVLPASVTGPVDVDPRTLDPCCRALQRELLGVAVQPLQQRAAHAEGHVVGRIAVAGDALQDGADRIRVDAIALDHPHVVEYAVALAVEGVAERFIQPAQAFGHHVHRVTRVGADDQVAPEAITSSRSVVPQCSLIAR